MRPRWGRSRYDAASQTKLHQYATQVEDEIIAAGLPVVVRRASQIFFHSTLGQIPQEDKAAFTVAAAVEQVNSKIAPGSWVPEPGGLAVQQVGARQSACGLHNNRPKFALSPLFSGATLKITPAQSDFQ